MIAVQIDNNVVHDNNDVRREEKVNEGEVNEGEVDHDEENKTYLSV